MARVRDQSMVGVKDYSVARARGQQVAGVSVQLRS